MSTSGEGAPSFPAGGFDALPPPAMARRAEETGVAKAALSTERLLVLAVLAGAFIAMGAVFATTVTAGSGEMAFGVTRLLAGLTFSLGLILVVVAGAELFTGNNLIVMAWAARRVTSGPMLAIWGLVYLGNFAGAIATAVLVYLSGQYELGGGAVGEQALNIAVAKTDLAFGRAIVLGALCNALVCLAVWLAYSARSTADRILAIVPPIAAFVAVGFEHSVANMYFIPAGLLLKGNEEFVAGLAAAPDLSGLTWGAFLLDNLLPVTIGNILGGSVMVGAVYWFVYLRGDR